MQILGFSSNSLSQNLHGGAHKLLPGSVLGNYWITWNMLVWHWSALFFSVFNDTACIVDALLTYTCWSSFSLCISGPLHSDPQSRDLAHFRRLVIQELWGYSWDTAGHKAIKVDKASEENVLVHSEHSLSAITLKPSWSEKSKDKIGMHPVEVAQSCLTLCGPMDYSLPDFSICGVFQARVPEWVAISFSRGSSWPRDRTQVSRIVGRCFI